MGKGRPREFDVDQALDKALHVFWKRGYEGASLPELTEAMGINRPSLYAAFGNKESLFRQALDRYVALHADRMQAALAMPTSREVVAALLYASADAPTCPGQPRGCLIVQGALACGEETEPIRQAINAQRAASEAAVRKRLARAKREGDLPQDASPADLARFVATVQFGLAVHAASGASRAALHRVVEVALQAWPG